MYEDLKEQLTYIEGGLENEVLAGKIAFGELTLTVRAENIIRVLMYLKEDGDCLYEQLVDVSAADYPEREKRFEVVYHLLSYTHNHRIRIKVEATEETLVPSATGVFSSANWFEREVWDMYGVMFSGHPDMRRILTDYGFEGHPLRKDFPLTGFVEVRYSEEQKRVIYEPVKVPQEFRNFDFMSPWEGAKYILDDGVDEGEDNG